MFDRSLRGLIYVVIVVSFGLLVVAMSHPGVPATHDSAAHFTYAYLFDRAIAQGQFPVRWIEWVRDGHGQPLFSFYQPGLYYLTQITHVVVPSLSRSLSVTVLIAWCLGCVVHLRVAAPAWRHPRGGRGHRLRVFALPGARRLRARRVSGIRRGVVRAWRVVEPRSIADARARPRSADARAAAGGDGHLPSAEPADLQSDLRGLRVLHALCVGAARGDGSPCDRDRGRRRAGARPVGVLRAAGARRNRSGADAGDDDGVLRLPSPLRGARAVVRLPLGIRRIRARVRTIRCRSRSDACSG